MSIIPGYAIQVIPSDLGTLIALDRDRLDADVAAVIQQEETGFVRGFDFQCEVVDDEVVVNKGRVRSSSVAPSVSYNTNTVPLTVLTGFLPEEEGSIFIEVMLVEDFAAATLTGFGTVTFVNEYNYAAGMSNRPVFTFGASVSKGAMPPSERTRFCVRLAEYSVDSEGAITITQTHFGSITVPQPTQSNDFAIDFGIV